MSEEIVILDFSTTCRTCLTQNNDMHPINDSIKTVQNNNFIIKDMLMSCTQLQISDNDGLPAHICIKCVCRVSDAYLFKLNCEKSEKTLKENLNSKTLDENIIRNTNENENNCETFKDNVMNLINIAVNDTNCFDTTLNPIWQSEKDKIPLKTNVEQSKKNSITDQHKRNQKRSRVNKKNFTKSNKMVKIAPKQTIIDTNISYNDHNKIIAINIPTVDVKQSKFSKFTENVEIKNQCKFCGIYFISENDLQSHLSQDHNMSSAVDIAKNICNICNIEFSEYERLNEHNILQHCRNISYRCDECLNWYSDKELLRKHKCLLHTKINKSLSCDTCDKKFLSIRGLTIHKALHNIKSKENKISCKICDRTFSIMSNLTYHMKYHKSDICQYCNSGFCSLNMMKDHMKDVHGDKKPYSCSYCSKNFNARKVLLKHKRIVHGVFKEVYFCGVCKNSNVGFLTHEILNKHISKYHKLATNELKTNSCELNDNLGINNNISQIISDVNTNHITLNDDGTINITTFENIQQDYSSFDAIENTIKVLKQEIFMENKIENNFAVTDMGEYTINEINRDENITNVDINDLFTSGKIIDYDEDKQQYTLRYDSTDYVISAEGLNQTQNEYDANICESHNQELLEKKDEESADKNFNFSCKLCNITFVDQVSFNDHIPKHNSAARNLNECKVLQKAAVENSFDIKDGMVRINIDITTGMVSFEKSDIIFSEQDYVHVSKGEKLDVPRYRCPKCDDLFTRQYSLNRHLAHTHNEMCLVCNTCGESFNRVSLLEEHRSKHKNMLNMGVIITSVENAASDGNHVLQNSVQGITESLYVYEPENQSFPCELCNKTFQRQIYLERHRLIHMGLNQPGFMCTICNKIFLTSIDMQKHKRKHNEEYLQCNLCDRTFTTIGGLKYHLKTHTGTKNHKCPFCGKKFTANVNLNAHVKTVHSEVKPHLCNICGKRYTTIDHLRKHMVNHTGERKFQCGVCGKDFTQNSHLTQHSWIHSGIKPHACKYCDNKYTSSSALKKHIQSNHVQPN